MSDEEANEREGPDSSGVVVRTSADRSWCGIRVEQKHPPPGEYRFGCEREVAVSVELGPPVWLECQLDRPNRKERVWSGQVHVAPAGAVARMRHLEPSPHLEFFIEPEPLAHAAEAAGMDPRRIDIVPAFNLRDPVLSHCTFALHDLLLQGDAGPGESLLVDGLVQALCGRLLLAHRAPASRSVRVHRLTPRQLGRVIDYMQGNLAERIRLAELAALVGLKGTQFSRCFRETTGESPHQFLLRTRVEQAHALLEQGVSGADAAGRCGFCDQSHLSRTMRKLMGVTPAAVRRRSR